MNDSLLDDVKALLDKDFGDDRILKQICRACENNEIISNYERNYVTKLAEKHLGKIHQIIQTPVSAEEIPTIPDVVLPTTTAVQTVRSNPARPIRSKIKNTKLLGIAAVALIVIAVAAVSLGGIPYTPSGPVSVSLSVQTDSSSYDASDIISISGVSDTSKAVTLSILDKDGNTVWEEKVSLKGDGRYSTLVIAGGPGWESSGTYAIKVDNGAETKSGTLSFEA